MPFKPFSQSQYLSANQGTERRRSLSERLKLRSFTRSASRDNEIRSQSVDSQGRERNIAAAAHNEDATSHKDVKSIKESDSLIISPLTSVNDMTQARVFQVECTGADKIDNVVVDGQKDIWSAAYSEAIQSMGDKVNSVILQGEKLETVLQNLQKTNEDNAENSLFRRGVRKLDIPLKSLKLALDVTKPFLIFEPNASTAVGVVSCVTAFAIGVCGAEEALNDPILSMLEHVAIIDECDRLGQRLEPENGIHRALVPVYKDLLHFYVTVLDIISSNFIAFALLCENINAQLPTIIKSFLHHVNLLRSRIEAATFELLTDIKRMLQDNKIQKLLGLNINSDRSNFHSERRDSYIASACDWIMMDSRFLAWLKEPSSSQLILFGALGSGKTIVSAHVIEELIRVSKHKLPRSFICYHYCHNYERGKARYIFSSLILQLLKQQESLVVEFDKWYTRLSEGGLVSPTESHADLGDFLLSCVESLDRDLYIVIDGLDECDDQSQYQLLALLDKLSRKAQKLKAFLSSRPQGTLSSFTKESNTIIWEPSERRDAILVEHLVKTRLQQQGPECQSLVRARISELAQGSAVWIQLTIELIKKKRFRAIGPLKSFLNDVPSPVEVFQLYQRLFAHQTDNDEENIHLASEALEMLAVTRRPLNILELGWLVALRIDATGARSVKEVEECVDARRVLELLQPFLLHVNFKDEKKRQIELVHKSLKEFIQKQSPSKWESSQNRPPILSKEKFHSRLCKLEANMLHSCVKYLLIDDFDQQNLLSEEQETVETLNDMAGFRLLGDNEEDQASDESTSEDANKGKYYDPTERGFGEFFVYASCNWLDHYRASCQDLAPNIEKIIELCRVGSKKFNNWLGQKCRPDCTIVPKIDYEAYLEDTLHIIALEGPEYALKRLVEDSSIDLDGKDFKHDTVKKTIYNILRLGDISRLCILFHAPKLAPKVRNIGIFDQMMREWRRSDKTSAPWSGCFDLVFEICDDVLIKELWANELLCLAASYGCLPLVVRMFEEAVHNPAMRDSLLKDMRRETHSNLPVHYHQSVGVAVWHNNISVLRYLLEQEGIEAHLKHRDPKGNNVIHKAARHYNPEVIELLVSQFPEGVTQRNEDDDVPLDVIVFSSSRSPDLLESIKILLRQGNVDMKWYHSDGDRAWKDPIRVAARNGNAMMCRVLVELGGADPRNALRFEDGPPALKDPMHFDENASEILDTLCSLAGIDRQIYVQR